MDWKENWPYDAAADKANVAQDLEVAKEKVGVEGAIVEDMGIRDVVKGLDPIKQARRQLRGRYSKTACVRCEQTSKSKIVCVCVNQESKRDSETTGQEESSYSGYRRLGIVLGA